jgi:galactofuranose transport system ATP-binding protein
MSEVGKLDLVSLMLGREMERLEGHATAFGKRTGVQVGAELFSANGLAARHGAQNVSFGVRKGEVVGLAGLLGAGRTETARVVFGADPLRAGEMRLEGAPYAPHRPADAIAAGLGFLSEDRKGEGIIPEMTVAENLTLPLLPQLSRNGVLDETRQRQLVERFIRELGIKCSGPGQKVRELSGGNQQKVLLARWLAMNPRLLILDEPTRGIDVGAKAEIQRLIRRLADDGLGVLMISSELEEVIEGANRIFVLREGVSVKELDGENASEEQVLAAMAHGLESARESAA